MTHSSNTLKWLLSKVKSHIPSLFFLTLFSIGASLSGVFFALGSKNVIDAAVSGKKDVFFYACLVQIGIILSILICTVCMQHLKERIHASLDRTWKITLLGSVIESEYRDVSKFHSGELLNRLNNDVRTLDDSIVNLLPNLCGMVIKLVAAFGILSAMTPGFAVVMLLAGILVILATGIFRKKLKRLYKQVSEADGRVSGILQEVTEKLLAVQAMGIADEIQRRVKLRLNERFDAHRRRKNLSLFANLCIYIMYYGAGFAALASCSYGLLTATMTFGTMTAVIQLVNQLQSPLVGLSGIMPQYVAATAATERLQELDSLQKSAPPCKCNPVDLYERMDSIVAENISFTYDRDCVLNNTGFSLPKSSFCVITGQSGAGKSTLLKLLLGIFKPESGGFYLQCGNERIPIDESTRRLFDYVPQGNLVFSGSILDNLLVVRPDATENEIAHAIYVSTMDQFLPQLPDGLNTVLGEGGAGLSEGQIQRLAIARAILGNSPVLLLDECTSALDMQTEALMMSRLCELKGKTCIAVTHRPVDPDICDISINIEHGNIFTTNLLK